MTPLTTKAARHQRIIEVISRSEVHTQDELRAALLDAGHEVTQATLSRDLVELGASKVVARDGSSRYVVAEIGVGESAVPVTSDTDVAARLARVTAEVMTGADFALNTVVLHTKPGAANYLAGAIDRNAWPDVLGSVAGDDTVIVVARTEEAAAAMCESLLDLCTSKSRKPVKK